MTIGFQVVAEDVIITMTRTVPTELALSTIGLAAKALWRKYGTNVGTAQGDAEFAALTNLQKLELIERYWAESVVSLAKQENRDDFVKIA